jgi:hypothetical protein
MWGGGFYLRSKDGDGEFVVGAFGRGLFDFHIEYKMVSVRSILKNSVPYQHIHILGEYNIGT